MHQHSIIIEIAEQLRKALAGAEQKALILHGETGVLIQVQGAPQYLYPLAVPVRPQVFTGIVDHSHAAATVLPMPRQQRLDDLLLQLLPARRGARRRLHRYAAQALKQQHIWSGMFFVRHDAINHRHTHRTITRRVEIFHASCRAAPGVVKLRASSGIGFPAHRTGTTAP